MTDRVTLTRRAIGSQLAVAASIAVLAEKAETSFRIGWPYSEAPLLLEIQQQFGTHKALQAATITLKINNIIDILSAQSWWERMAPTSVGVGLLVQSLAVSRGPLRQFPWIFQDWNAHAAPV